MKVCGRCKSEKELIEFSTNKRKQDGKQSNCKDCVRQYDNAYYKNNSKRRTKTREKNSRSVVRNRIYVLSHLSTHPCVDCGEPDPVVLEFDHVRETKRHNISDMVKHSMSIKTIQLEIDKCEVRCANCHRRKTAKQFGYHENSSGCGLKA
jgi:hypothetical protein